MALGSGQPVNPLLAPWPPGVDYRLAQEPRHGVLVQLRPGALTPMALHMAAMERSAHDERELQRSAEDWFRRTHGRLAHA